MSRYIAIAENKVEDFTDIDWETWINTGEDSLEMTANMAIHKQVRDRGGIFPDEVLRLHVYVRETMETPCSVSYFQINAREE